MKITSANRSIYLDLYQAAIEFREMAPWEWMWDSDYFGVQDPETGETGWCCIMGAAGEVFALNVYLGDEGFHSYMRLAEVGETRIETPELFAAFLEQKLLKVDFVGREEIDDTDRAMFKDLGLKFRGHGNWVQARDFLPGYYPWYLSEKQAVFMTHCLRQAMEVAARFRDDESILEDEEGDVLVRVPKKTSHGLEWSDQFMPEPEWEDKPEGKADPFLVNRAKKELKKKNQALFFSLSYVQSAMKDEGEDRPFFPQLGLWIDGESGLILGMEMFSPSNFRHNLEKVFFKHLHQAGFIPQQLFVDSEAAMDAAGPIAKALGTGLVYAPDLEVFEEIKRELGRYFAGDFGLS
jgi:hypothetical protein